MSVGRVIWVSGIDTGIGKTVVTGLMAKNILAAGVDVLTVKMVQTGCDGFSEDLDVHRAIMGLGEVAEDREGLTAPEIFKYPSSPLLAAQLEGRKVDCDKIAAAVKTCAERHELVLVESAGGLAVPLTEDKLSADFAAEQGWPLLLVTSGKLGAINHAILSLEAAKQRGMRVVGVVHNYHCEANAEIDADAKAAILRTLKRLGYPEVLVCVPEVKGDGQYPEVDFSPILKEMMK